MEKNYVIQITGNFNGTPVYANCYVDERASDDVDVKIASRSLKKILDSTMISGEIDGYEMTVSRGLLIRESVVPDKILYHKEKGDMELDKDSGE